MKTDNIILTGMPGCGKTTVGTFISKKYDFSFIDLDLLIESNENLKITEIFKTKGEEYFRELETKTIESLIDENHTRLVLSLGGGTILRDKNYDLLKKIGKIFYLEISVDKIYDRIKTDLSRPLLQTENPYKKLSEMFGARESKYKKADYTIDASCSAEEIADKIYEKIKR